MKYAILIGDGMGDYPLESLGGLTPLEHARTPNLDRLAAEGLLSRCQTVPEGMPPGSDVAIMSLLGYSAKGVLTGRGPLEAAALGIPLAPGDLAFRLNLATCRFEGDDIIMVDHSAGDIPAEEAGILLKDLSARMPLAPGQSVRQGVNYRNIFIWPGAPLNLASIPPHDHLDKSVRAFLDDPAQKPVMDLVKASWPILRDHPVNLARVQKGLRPANTIWLWGQGSAPKVKTYAERWGVTGATASAVDIIRGLAIITGLTPLVVPGATGALDTNYEGKAQAALKALETLDLAVIHLEAPDECSHQGDLAAKIQAIENFDAKIVGPVLAALPSFGPFRLLCSPDHYTPVSLKSHVSDPVPFVFYDSERPGRSGARGYSEKSALEAGGLVPDGPSLGRLLFGPERG
ncbi:MAG: cofactor-independent phosphoglycerate mutase [Deltaproteobacteria bacterium]|jgi:2,3-bisphosphoglycerate-independent phosphoglycerate mutase|nr:cofactor-independent phosphoglycerate mutase [Deltaproteobacteria bacterium]